MNKIGKRNIEYIYSKRDYRFFPIFILIFIGIIFATYKVIIFLFLPSLLKKEQGFEEYAILIFLFIVLIVCSVYLFREFFIKRVLKINDWGVEYWVGKKLELGAPWNKIGKIRTIGFQFDVIEIYKKNSDWPYAFFHMHSKERINAFKKLAEYAQKYNIEIDDRLGYLSKYLNK